MSKSNKSSEEIDSFKEKVKKDAEELILTKFPKKILDLDALLNGEKFSPNLDLTRVDINIPIPESPTHENANTSGEGLPAKQRQTLKQSFDEIENEDEMSLLNKPFLFPMGVVESNKNLMELIDVLKPQMLELIEDIILLKLGISLMIPKIEDGDNIGVEIQSETIDAISHIENDVQKQFDSFSTYFQSRGDLIVKVAKYPHAEDFRRAVQERDQKFNLNLCITLTDIRNYYASLHDLVTKNLKKIKKPKSEDNKDFLY